MSDCEVLFFCSFLFCTYFCSWLVLVPLFYPCTSLPRLIWVHPPSPLVHHHHHHHHHYYYDYYDYYYYDAYSDAYSDFDSSEALAHRSFYTKALPQQSDGFLVFLSTQTLLHTGHTKAFTHKRVYTQKLLHTEAFTPRSFYTQKLLHTEAFTPRSFYTQNLLHTDAFTQTFTHKRFYTQNLLLTSPRSNFLTFSRMQDFKIYEIKY